MTNPLLSELVALAAATQRAYRAARDAGDAELARVLLDCGWAVTRALAKAARGEVSEVVS